MEKMTLTDQSGALTTVDLRMRQGTLTVDDIPRPAAPDEETVGRVRQIIAQVRAEGDVALRSLTKELDGVNPVSLVLGREQMEEAFHSLATELAQALTVAHRRIQQVYEAEVPTSSRVSADGITVVRRNVPVRSAGCYVPGGSARYPSTVLHTATVAAVAGVEHIVVATPPSPEGSVDAPTLAAAFVAGVEAVYPIGGAQAIAALAYGTESIERVDTIAGPGNLYVALAKAQVALDVGIGSSFAGPSEVVVIADPSVDPRYAALDLAVQAEHGPHGLAWLVTWDEQYLHDVDRALVAYVDSAPRLGAIRSTLANNGYAALVRGREQALELANLIAPEHLELLYQDGEKDAALVKSAGVTFVGIDGTAAFGDYVAGPSHVLPTYGTARFASGLGLEDFYRRQHTVLIGPSAIDELGWAVEEIAKVEGLYAHAESIAIRRRS
ncbi:histidinol dehydrogenase [Ferrimicrobium acidiphilum]|uniref:histidinol dehydrogenase n=1 Tax=Ferrimicrobium acidiphilum TaxID=121039 RepID=UPI0023F5714E|nr:histidinol dehydrogenase [Ferrimicrobium acidiphilum]